MRVRECQIRKNCVCESSIIVTCYMLRHCAGAAAALMATVCMCEYLCNTPGIIFSAGESMGTYVPQALLSKDGVILDADLVLSEIVADGDEVVLEYSEGPLAFRSRSV